jgi:4Fe-4S ferredoxin
MPLRTIKKETADTLMLEWVLHVKDYKLILDKNRCAGCQICSLACPKEAIKVTKQPKAEGEKAIKAKVDIDLAKCNFCGICDVLCPYGAMKITLDGQHLLSVVEKESFPLLIRDIQVDPSKYAASSKKCEDACPLNLIKVSIFAADGKAPEDVSSMKKKKRARRQVEINVEKDRCPCCRICEFRCPEGVIRVRKFLYGMMVINTQKCPEGCRDCLDVCPLTGVLYFSDEDKKVHANEMFCVYCGACMVVCPVEKALELKRTKICHTPVSSGAWNKALERIASPIEMTKELKAKDSQKAVEAVERLLVPKSG